MGETRDVRAPEASTDTLLLPRPSRPTGHARTRTGRHGSWVRSVGACLVALLMTACSASPGTSDAGSDAGGTAAAGDDAAPGSDADATPPQADPTAALAEFQPPADSSGVAAAQPAECPGVNPAHVIAVFPEARPYEAASHEVESRDASADEVTVECRLSYEVELDDDECTFMETREVTFTPAAVSVIDGHAGSLVATSRTTYFTGAAQRDGVQLQYTLQAGCAEMTDLSDYEDEFRAVWEANRDAFIAAPAFSTP